MSRRSTHRLLAQRQDRLRSARGFTLIEILIVIAIIAILTSIALPSYTAYIKRSKVPAGLDALQSYFTRMEQRFQDSGTYASGSACAISLPTAAHFSFACTLGSGNTSYTLTATGSGTLAGYSYSINSSGTRVTVAHPKGAPSGNCWSIKGAVCDA